jgi:hypothetical protein
VKIFAKLWYICAERWGDGIVEVLIGPFGAPENALKFRLDPDTFMPPKPKPGLEDATVLSGRTLLNMSAGGVIVDTYAVQPPVLEVKSV